RLVPPTAASDTRDPGHGVQGALVLGTVSVGSGSTGATYSAGARRSRGRRLPTVAVGNGRQDGSAWVGGLPRSRPARGTRGSGSWRLATAHAPQFPPAIRWSGWVPRWAHQSR